MKRAWRSGYLADDSGAVAAIYAMALPAIVAVAGVGWDYARVAGLDSEMQNAADQAALAAVTQLDGESGACTRAAAAAATLITNNSLLANAGEGLVIAVANEAACDGTGVIRFYSDVNQATGVKTAATGDANANYVEIVFNADNSNTRTANYAFPPIVGAFYGEIGSAALAGLRSSVCKVPPIMICHPDPANAATYNWDVMKGVGIQATGHSPGNAGGKSGGDSTDGSDAWSPGNFGFLQVEDPDANNKNAALLRALAYYTPTIECVDVEDNKVSTGNPQGLYDAINTRFDMYDFNSNDSGQGNVLASCQGTNCPPSSNVVKDFLNTNTNLNGNSCKVGNNGWELPDNEFNPVNSGGPYYHDANDDGVVNGTGEDMDAMGLPRDLCHYETFNGTGWCGGTENTGRFGNKVWAIRDYFRENHGMASLPSGITSSSTRYEVYNWEIDNSSIPNTGTTGGQRGTPVCYNGSPAGGDRDRRKLTIAVVTNCSSLNGTSQPVVIQDWIDVFLVEPASDEDKRHNAYKDSIYFEVIKKSDLAGDGTYASQQIRRDVPYLME